MAEARKTDYFGTFLDELASRGPKPVASVTPLFSQDDLSGAIIRTLTANGGGATLPVLFAPPFSSMNSLMATIQTLESFGLVARDGAKIMLTEDGHAMAAKLSSASSLTAT